MATDEAVGEAATTKAAANIEKALRVWNWLATSLPLLTVFGFTGTVMVLWSIFGAWGLSGIQLVSPADVALPGIAIGYLVVTIIYLPFALAEFAGWFSTGPKSGAVITGLAVVLMAVSLVWYCFVSDSQWRLLAAFFGASSGIIFLRQAVRSTKLSRLFKIWVVAAGLLLAVWLGVWIYGTTGAFFNQIIKVGLARGVYVIEKDAACMGKVLWWGERAIVIRCSVGSEEIRVMPPKDDLKFSTERELALASKYVAQ